MTGSMIVPLYQTSTFKWPEVGTSTGFEYSRTDNPTRTALQESFASLEEANWGLALASGIKTRPVRMECHGENAMTIANFLNDHAKVVEVYCPGLPEGPGHERAKRQMRNFGGMVSMRLQSREAAITVCTNTRIFQLAESLGDVDSLIEHPDSMTPLAVSGTEFAIDSNVVRMSVGIENIGDQISGISNALERVS